MNKGDIAYGVISTLMWVWLIISISELVTKILSIDPWHEVLMYEWLIVTTLLFIVVPICLYNWVHKEEER